MLYSTSFHLLGLGLDSNVSSKGLLSLNKVVAVTKGYVAQEMTLEFQTGTEDDETPLLNFALHSYPFTERLDMYFDIGATDTVKDLDTVSTVTMYPLYLDPAYVRDIDHAIAGVLPPKLMMMRCLIGSGLVYLNASPTLDVKTNLAAPLPLHAESGLLYYTFPKEVAHAARSGNTMLSMALVSIFLRTFEPSSRFQISLFK